MGASMVKWTKKVLQYKFRPLLVKRSSKALFKLDISSPDDLCCCVEYSNEENEVGIFNTHH